MVPRDPTHYQNSNYGNPTYLPSYEVDFASLQNYKSPSSVSYSDLNYRGLNCQVTVESSDGYLTLPQPVPKIDQQHLMGEVPPDRVQFLPPIQLKAPSWIALNDQSCYAQTFGESIQPIPVDFEIYEDKELLRQKNLSNSSWSDLESCESSNSSPENIFVECKSNPEEDYIDLTSNYLYQITDENPAEICPFFKNQIEFPIQPSKIEFFEVMQPPMVTSPTNGLRTILPASSYKKSHKNTESLKRTERRLKNNIASQKSRAQRKKRFQNYHQETKKIQVENDRLKEFILNLDIAIEEANAALNASSQVCYN